jgi:hypothetical protein
LVSSTTDTYSPETDFALGLFRPTSIGLPHHPAPTIFELVFSGGILRHGPHLRTAAGVVVESRNHSLLLSGASSRPRLPRAVGNIFFVTAVTSSSHRQHPRLISSLSSIARTCVSALLVQLLQDIPRVSEDVCFFFFQHLGKILTLISSGHILSSVRALSGGLCGHVFSS